IGIEAVIVADSWMTLGIQLDRSEEFDVFRIYQLVVPLLTIPRRIMQTAAGWSYIGNVRFSGGIHGKRRDSRPRTQFEGKPLLVVLATVCIAQNGIRLVEISDMKIAPPINGHRGEPTYFMLRNTIHHFRLPTPH